ncbi:MAG: cellulase family glycosylhydrolase [Capsulimonadaceae bacterium]|nr:cellulase family glycosylhydrolase [Capsulimonadaceae bacterium]
MQRFVGFEKGIGLGGWLTNYKRMGQLSPEMRRIITIGDEEHFDDYITEDDVKYIRSLGVDHIRLGFDQMVVEAYDNPYEYRERGFQHIDDFLMWCHKCDLNVVLNLHKAIGNYCECPSEEDLLTSSRLQDRFVSLWAYLEDRYSNESNVAFELLNEVTSTDGESWNRLANRTIDEIRRRNEDRSIIVGSPEWNSPRTLDRLMVYDDPRIIYTFHFYEPMAFTHQRGVLNQSEHFYNRQMYYPSDIKPYIEHEYCLGSSAKYFISFERMDKSFLEACMKGAFAFVEAHPDKILYCGEFGTIRHTDLRSRENYMADVISLLIEHDIPYCVWNYLSTPNDGNRFSLVDDDERRILSERLRDIIVGEV